MVDKGIIVWNTRDPLGGLTREAFEDRFENILKGRVLEAWIFGSYGTSAFCRDSDIDVFLVVDTTRGAALRRQNGIFPSR